MESLLQDLRYGLKLLWKDKAYAATAVATLAICIAANTTIFSVVNSIILKPLPFPDSSRILFLYNSYPKAGVVRATSGVPDYYDRLRETNVFEEVALYNNPGLTIGDQVVTGTVALPGGRYAADAALRTFELRALEKMRAIHGVLSAGATDTIPFGDRNSDSVILAEGYQMKPGESLVSPNQIVVTPGYFEAMKIPLLEGRFINEHDSENSQRVLVIDQRLAHRFWLDSSPIGKRMWQPQSAETLTHPPVKEADWLTVVGVVGSVKLHGLVNPDERVGAYYFPYAQSPRAALTFAVRTGSEAAGLARAMRNGITDIDPELPLFDVRTMQERIDESLILRRSPMLLATAFGMVALFLAAVGLYGVLAYTVAQRTKEIGIRMALGSSALGIFKMILEEGVIILAIGFTIGLAGTLAIGKFIRSVLYGVGPSDPGVLASAIAILAVVSFAACVLPAHRATRVDPVIALRQE